MAKLIENIRSEVEDQESDLAPYRIVSYPADYTLKGLHDKWRAAEIEIPPFQRQYVWTLTQASRLIESFLLGLPVPGIFFYRDQDSQRLLVIDGPNLKPRWFGYNTVDTSCHRFGEEPDSSIREMDYHVANLPLTEVGRAIPVLL